MSSGSHRYHTFLKEMFPNQFNTIPRIIIWTLVFILDVVVVFYVSHLLGFDILNAAKKIVLMIYLVAAFALFCLESAIYNKIIQ